MMMDRVRNSCGLGIVLAVILSLPQNTTSLFVTRIPQSRIHIPWSSSRLWSTTWRDDDHHHDDDEREHPPPTGSQRRRRQIPDGRDHDDAVPKPPPPPPRKSGRFAQSAHVARPTTTSPSSQSASRSTPTASASSIRINNDRDSKRQNPKPTSSSASSFVSSSRPEDKASSSSFSPTSTSTPSSSSSSASDFMWKSGKSIDDLERIMKQRWGTKSDRWKADPSDYEDSNDGDDDAKNNGGIHTVGNAKSGSKVSSGTTGAAVFRRAKPVLDPWQPQAPPPPRQQQVEEEDNDEDDDEFDEDGDKDENVQDDDENDDFDKDEFYDEDDEGYEPSSKNKSSKHPSDWNLNHMIQPQPAGGKGTKSLLMKASSSSSSSSKSTLPKPFFLPRQELPISAIDANQNTNDNSSNNNKKEHQDRRKEPDEEETSIQRKSRSTTPSIPALDPVLDDGGNPIYLTLEQAERNFAAISSTLPTGMSMQVESDVVMEPPSTFASLEPSSSASMMMSWQELGITSKILLTNLKAMGCSTPLPVQQKSCPPILLGGKDVVVGTYTGSGKTLAVLVPLVQRLLWEQEQSPVQAGVEDDDDDDVNDIDDDEEEDDTTENYRDEGYTIDDSSAPTEETVDTEMIKRNTRAEMAKSSKSGSSSSGVQVLVVVPGRELASQMVSVARSLVLGTHLVPMLAIGGTTLARNWENIRKRKPQIIIGTPGRLAELIIGPPGERTGKLKVAALQSVVLDEFDALLDYKAHRDPTQGLLEFLKRRHQQVLQCVFCSATAGDMLNSPKVKNFLRPGFVLAMTDRDDLLVTPQTSSSSTAATRTSRTIIHGVVHVPHRRFALETLRKILHTDPLPQQILIFAENARRVDIVIEKLEEMGIVAAPLHGGMGSEKVDRAEVSKALREGYVGIVVATELAARGLDAPLLTHVINLELPTDASHYAHRAGRCGRGGRPGVVINFTTNAQERNVPHRFAEDLGIVMHTVEPRNGKLNIIHAPAPSQPVTI